MSNNILSLFNPIRNRKNYTIIKTVGDLEKAKAHIESHDVLAFDTEATGLNVRNNMVIGFSFCGEEGEAYYLPMFAYEDEKIVPKIPIDIAIDVLKMLQKKKLVMWNASYDVRIVKNDLGIDLLDSLYIEGMLLKHTLDEEGDFALKKVAVLLQEELGFDAEQQANEEQIALKENVKKNGGETSGKNFEMYKADMDVLGVYACADVDLTLKIVNYYLKKLKEENLEDFFFNKEVMPLYKEVTIPMEDKGVKLDLDLLKLAKKDIINDIADLEKQILDDLLKLDDVHNWLCEVSSTKYPPSPKGNFAQRLAELKNIPLPKSEKSGKYSMSKKNLENLPDSVYKCFLLGECVQLDIEDEREVQFSLWKDNQEGNYINISSKKQLKEIIFNHMHLKPLSKTPKGSPQFNDDYIDHISDQFEWAKKLSNYNKLIKIKGTYIDRFLDNHEYGYYYFSYKQHGTISGRYGSDAQQLPRPKEEGELDPIVLKYNNMIRKFFISGEERLFIDCDYESLEPHVFAHVSGDDGLKNIFRNGHDFYSTIAIATEGLHEYSADKKAENYLGKLNKPLRQKAKAYCFTKDTIVDTIKGPIPINEIRRGDQVYNRAGNIFNSVDNIYRRKTNTILVHTNRGTLECTDDHKFYVDGKWIEAKDLNKDDPLDYNPRDNWENEEVRLPIMSNFYFKNGGYRSLGHLTLDKDWGYFIGAMLGDGIISIDKKDPKYGHGIKGYVGICGDPKDKVVKKIETFLNSLGYNLRTLKEDSNCISRVVVNSELCKIVYDTLKLGDIHSSTKKKNLKIPDYIFKASEEIKLAFIAGLLDTDGYLKNKGNYSDVTFCSKDHRLSTGLVRLLKMLSVECSYRLDYNKTYKRYYYIVSISRLGTKRLAQLGLDYYLVCDRKKEAIKSQIDYKPKFPSRTRNPRVIVVEYTNIEKEVFDIRVQNEHEFYANGILVHNCLGVPYGMTGYALGKSLEISTEEAEELVDNYLNAYPNLKEWMQRSKELAQNKGYAVSEAGRVRHLPKVKELYKIYSDNLLDFRFRKKLLRYHDKDFITNIYRDYKNGINNSRNYQIQSLSASIVNRAAISINREFKKRNIDAWVCAQIHDQLIFNIPKNKKEECVEIVKYLMENNYKISIPLKSPPELAKNWYEGH